MATQFQVVGPDEIYLRPWPYQSREQAEAAIVEFVKRFTHQGYYRDCRRRKIHLDEIADLCCIVEVEPEPPQT